ncbi:neuronal acetylcholine receptor subunit alpha-3-like [Saccostrea echinata]|uniref:neuronal acetylcholine receptor subunit alpha-3-like n=1 Tax=Saccostrea echinata TaxID=191078 RepID=UPI002A81CD09|nr:neuronal acetylcholine receptor subunit alpha-3-like [Saccostrea echinata]
MSNVKAITKRFFEDEKYDKKIRPVRDYSTAVQMDVSLFLFSINKLDEVQEKLVTTAYLELVWIDEYLTWDPEDHEGIEHFYIPQKEIWTPDIVLKGGFTRFQELGGDFYYLDLDSDGQITWLPYEVFESRCPIDITYFPFDEQICSISFVIWSYARDEVEICCSNHGMKFYQYEENSIWSIVNTNFTIIDDPGIRESEIMFTLHLRRKPFYFIRNIIIPVVLLAILNILTFVIPVDSGEKLTFGMTVFLSFLVFLNVISAQLPTNSESTPLLGVYLEVQLGYSVTVLIVASLQLQIHHRDEAEIPSRPYVTIIKISNLMRCKSGVKIKPLTRNINQNMENILNERVEIDFPYSRDTNKLKQFHGKSGEGDHVKTSSKKGKGTYIQVKEGISSLKQADSFQTSCTWKDVSSALDIIAFWFFLVSNFVVTMVFFIQIYTGGERK